jgi:MOSC domain-containing protein YiiM
MTGIQQIDAMRMTADASPEAMGRSNKYSRDSGETGQMRIHHLYLSKGHNFFGRHGLSAGENPMTEVQGLECLAGRGVRGDRFLDYRENYKGQITFFAMEVYRAICQKLGEWHRPVSVFRRNVITEGVDLNELIGVEFEIQGVRFLGTEECKPCYWMDQAFAPGAAELLKGRGGLRAMILSGGKLQVNASRLVNSPP